MIIVPNVSVLDVQKRLNFHGFDVKEDGILGPKTEETISIFQRKRGLYADGIVGPVTWSYLLEIPDALREEGPKLKWISIPCDEWTNGKDKGYMKTTLREDVAPSFKKVADMTHQLGGLITSSGGRRFLDAPSGPNRSNISKHFLGTAHDLFVWSGMINPLKDPYVVVRSEENRWIVYARAQNGEKMKLKGWTYKHQEIEVEDKFINLTNFFKENGWTGIPARNSFFKSSTNPLGAEWWHFEFVFTEETTFGKELLKIYKRKDLEKFKLWDYRNVKL